MDFGADQSHLFGLRSPSKLTIQSRQRQISPHRHFEIGGIVNRQAVATGGGHYHCYIRRSIKTDPESRYASEEAGRLLFSQPPATSTITFSVRTTIMPGRTLPPF